MADMRAEGGTVAANRRAELVRHMRAELGDLPWTLNKPLGPLSFVPNCLGNHPSQNI